MRNASEKSPSAERRTRRSVWPICSTPTERAFGADFSDVRVAHDGRAAAVGAQAHAHGSELHLGAGWYNPESREGKALLGHELADVVQQRQGRAAAPQGKGAPAVADASIEAEADAAGAAVARGEPVPDSACDGGGGSSAAGQAKAEGSPIQMFEGEEHQKLGDAAHDKDVPNLEWAGAKDAPPEKAGENDAGFGDPAANRRAAVQGFRTHTRGAILASQRVRPRGRPQTAHERRTGAARQRGR